MCKKCILISTALIFALVMAGTVSADNYGWTGDGDATSWCDPCNWNLGVPNSTSVTWCLIDEPNVTINVDNGCSGMAYNMRLGNFDTNQTLNINSGGLLRCTNTWYNGNANPYVSRVVVKAGGTSNNKSGGGGYHGTGYWIQEGGTTTFDSIFNLGYHSDANGILEIQSGSVSGITSLRCGKAGTGLIQVTGGTLNIPGTLDIALEEGATGHVQLDGGQIQVNLLRMDYSELAASASMDITGDGVMYLNDGSGADAQTVNGYVSDGWITASETDHYVSVEWNGEDTTVVRALVRDYNLAWSPYPTNGSTLSVSTITLMWESGIRAQKHDVYLGTDVDAVYNADTSTTGIYKARVDVNNYGPVTLQLGKTYYWRIDEVNEVNNPDDIWTGFIWSFTITEYVPLDDFESYDSTTGGSVPLKDTWTKSGGYSDISLSTSQNHTTTPIIGSQSMYMTSWEYSDDSGEAEIEFASAQNWDAIGYKSMSVWFRGDSGNTDYGWYVKLTDANSASATLSSVGDANLGMTSESWSEWQIPLSDFSGVSLAGVKKVAVGIHGDDSMPQSNKMYFDDIQLFMYRCFGEFDSDLNNDCVIDLLDVALFVDEWLYSGMWP